MVSIVTCSALLLAGSIDSAHHYRSYLTDQLDRKDAEGIVFNLTQDICGSAPEYMNSNCRNLLPHADHTRVCAVETNIGYFFLMKDMLDGVNIVFNRWD